MFQRALLVGFLAFVAVAAVSGQNSPQPQRAPRLRQDQAPASAATTDSGMPRAVIDEYCVTCHNTRLKTGGLMLDDLDLSRLSERASIAEKMALKLRAGLMPPLRAPRPDKAT